MKYSRSIVSFALLAAIGTGSVFAQAAPPSQSPPQPTPSTMPEPGAADSSGAPAFSDLLKDKDKDKDKNSKYIERGDIPKDNEALKPMRAHFREADTDHNGKLDESEYQAYINKDNQPNRDQQR